MVKISIIMPVYNAEKHLREAIESVICQSFMDFELICVDDGSSDASAKILNEFSNDDSRIKVIRQKNKGAGSARNNGLKQCAGEYVCFMDSDDYIIPEFLQTLYANIQSNDSDMVLFKIGNIENDRKVRGWPHFPGDEIFADKDFDHFTFSYRQAKKYVMNESFAPWLIFYRKEFLDSYDDFLFEENVPYEDVLFHVKSMLRASKISFAPEYMYYYRLDSPDSCTSNQEDHIQIFKIIDLVGEFLKSEGYIGDFEREYEFFRVAQTTYHISDEIDEEYFKKAKEYLKGTDIEKNDAIPLRLKERYRIFFSSDDALTYRREIHIRLLLEKQDELKRVNKDLTGENERLKEIRDYQKDKKHELESSKSWRITKIFRSLASLFR